MSYENPICAADVIDPQKRKSLQGYGRDGVFIMAKPSKIKASSLIYSMGVKRSNIPRMMRCDEGNDFEMEQDGYMVDSTSGKVFKTYQRKLPGPTTNKGHVYEATLQPNGKMNTSRVQALPGYKKATCGYDHDEIEQEVHKEDWVKDPYGPEVTLNYDPVSMNYLYQSRKRQETREFALNRAEYGQENFEIDRQAPANFVGYQRMRPNKPYLNTPRRNEMINTYGMRPADAALDGAYQIGREMKCTKVGDESGGANYVPDAELGRMDVTQPAHEIKCLKVSEETFEQRPPEPGIELVGYYCPPESELWKHRARGISTVEVAEGRVPDVTPSAGIDPIPDNPYMAEWKVKYDQLDNNGYVSTVTPSFTDIAEKEKNMEEFKRKYEQAERDYFTAVDANLPDIQQYAQLYDEFKRRYSEMLNEYEAAVTASIGDVYANEHDLAEPRQRYTEYFDTHTIADLPITVELHEQKTKEHLKRHDFNEQVAVAPRGALAEEGGLENEREITKLPYHATWTPRPDIPQGEVNADNSSEPYTNYLPATQERVKAEREYTPPLYRAGM